MKITITFPDSPQESFPSLLQTSYAIKISTSTILSTIRNRKKKIIRKRDKAGFQIEVKDYPRFFFFDYSRSRRIFFTSF